MNRADRKKITANGLYLNECLSILYTKIRASGFNFFDKDGNLHPTNTLNIESYNHGTITCAINRNSVRVNYDGTNFAPIFGVSNNCGFVYKLKPLGIEYTCFDRKLDEVVHEKKILRKVGDSVDFYRYLSCGTFFILLEYSSKDENGVTMVINTLGRDYSDSQLISYIQEQMQLGEEIAQIDDADEDILLLDEEVVATEEAAYSMEDFVEPHKVLNKGFSSKELEEIEAYISDDGKYSDLFVIDYSLADILKDKMTDTPYESDYPERIEDFDYQKYISEIKSGVGEEVVYYTEDSNQHDSKTDEAEIDEADTDDDYEYDEYIDENSDYDDGLSDDLYSATDTISTEEGFINDSYFKVIRNGNVIEDGIKCDIVDEAVEGIMDVNHEVMTLQDYYCDLISELKKMRAIIIKRKEQTLKRKAGQTESDVCDSGKKSDKDIEY